jgi:hypothetical protein
MHVPSQPFDAITAFAVPNPNCSSQSQSVFSGLVVRPVTLPSESLSLLRISNDLFSLTLSAVDGCQAKQLLEDCQRRFSVQSPLQLPQTGDLQCVESLQVSERRTNCIHFFHIVCTAIGECDGTKKQS